MKINVVERFAPANIPNELFLSWDDWNDFDYYTLFGATYIDHNGVKWDLGGVRVAYIGQEKGRFGK